MQRCPVSFFSTFSPFWGYGQGSPLDELPLPNAKLRPNIWLVVYAYFVQKISKQTSSSNLYTVFSLKTGNRCIIANRIPLHQLPTPARFHYFAPTQLFFFFFNYVTELKSIVNLALGCATPKRLFATNSYGNLCHPKWPNLVCINLNRAVREYQCTWRQMDSQWAT